MIELFSPSEYSYVMNDLKDCTNLEDANVTQLLEPLEGYIGNYETDQTELRDTKNRKRKICDSTIQSSPNIENLPCLNSFPGQFNFELFLPSDCAAHRWTFSPILNKVFIDIDKVLALQFRWNHRELKQDVQLFVRALPVYTSSDWLKVAVMRCPLHVLPDHPTNNNFAYVEHVIRCEHSNTTYEKDEVTKRLSCITPLSYPQPGSDTTTLTYKFVCKTSCPSGMDRKPISVIFTLEDINGYVFGRQCLAVKICSCPKRDRQKEELNEAAKKKTPKVSKSSHPKTGVLSIKSCKEASTSNETLVNLQHAERNEKCSKNKHDELVRELKEIKTEIQALKSGKSEPESMFDSYGRWVASQLKELPRQQAYEILDEIQLCFNKKRTQLNYRCLTPAPSLASPDHGEAVMTPISKYW